MIRHGNPIAAITVTALIAVLLIGFWIMIPIYNQISGIVQSDETIDAQLNEADCLAHRGNWVTEDGAPYCSVLPFQAINTIRNQRRAWLAAPFIFIVSLIIWLIHKSVSRDQISWQQ